MMGDKNSIEVGKPYHLRVECAGNTITLFENNVPVLSVKDEAYETGRWGLRTYRAQAKFDTVELLPSKPKCFVIMPFAPALKGVYDVIKEVVTSFDIDCERADEIFVSSPVTEDLKKLIAEADLIIIDFTGKNPNVYFEAGLAYAWSKKWILLAQDDDDLAFDVRNIRTIFYANTMGADAQLKEDLRKAIRETMGIYLSSS